MSQNLSKYLTEFLEHLEIERNRSRLTLQNYHFYILRFIEWFGDKKPEAITGEDVRKYRLYLNRFIANAANPDAAWVPHTIDRYKPKPGDLICTTRGKIRPPELIEEVQNVLDSWRMHCDVVVEANGQTMQVIGGNVRNSVSKTILTLSSDGYVQFTPSRPWVLIVENRLD